jgi:hypothetical protein
MASAPISLHVYKGADGLCSGGDRVVKAADKSTIL